MPGTLQNLWGADGEMECPRMHAIVDEEDPATAHVTPDGCCHEHALTFKRAAKGRRLDLVRWTVC